MVSERANVGIADGKVGMGEGVGIAGMLHPASRIAHAHNQGNTRVIK